MVPDLNAGRTDPCSLPEIQEEQLPGLCLEYRQNSCLLHAWNRSSAAYLVPDRNAGRTAACSLPGIEAVQPAWSPPSIKKVQLRHSCLE